MHAKTLLFVVILFLSVSGTLRHERIGEVFIYDTCLGTTMLIHKARLARDNPSPPWEMMYPPWEIYHTIYNLLSLRGHV
jgi:hypothetical protein